MLQNLPYYTKIKPKKFFSFFILSNSGLCRHGPGYLHGKNVELVEMKTKQKMCMGVFFFYKYGKF